MMTMINDEKSSPQARAGRLKRVRNLANLSRLEMCQGSGFSVETLKGWENCRHGGLSKQGALKVVKRLALAGVTCSTDWLLYEIGAPPQIHDLQMQNHSDIPDSAAVSFDQDRENAAEELMLFRTHYPKSLSYVVADESMLPGFAPHDIVAGLKARNLEDAVGQYSIAILHDGKQLLRMVTKGNEPGCFTLISMNPHAQVPDLFLTNVSVKMFVPVIWHRRHLQDNSKAD